MPTKALEKRQAAMRKRMSGGKKESPAVATFTEGLQPLPDPPSDWEPKITVYYGHRDITREDLYKLAWSEAIVKIASRFGVSDVAIAKACRKHHIPLPGRGYWACIAAGQKLPRPALPKLTDASVNRITFRARQKQEAPKFPVVVATEEVVIEGPTAPLHPFAKETKVTLHGKNIDRMGRCTPGLGLIDVRVSPSQVDRAVRLLSALLKAAERRGHKTVRGKQGAEKDDRWAKLCVNGIEISFEVQERIQQTRHIPTKTEEREIARGRDYSVPKHDFGSTGELALRITKPWAQIQTVWTDAKSHRIEDCLGTILETFTIVAEAEHNRQRKQDEERQREIERQRQRWEHERRVKRLDEQLACWTNARKIRAYTRIVEKAAIKRGGVAEPENELGQWVAWMRRYADAIDPSRREDIGR